MAKFKMELPNEIIKDISNIYNNTDIIFGKMTEAGAKVVYQNIQQNVPSNFADSEIMNCLKITRTYRTPSDGGINNKVGFYGYFTNHNGVKTPAPLVAGVFEYGSSKFTKKPFLRRSFKKSQIEAVMLEAQRKFSKGLLDE